MKKNMMLHLIFAASSLLSCDSDDLLKPELPEYFVFNGDTLTIRKEKGLKVSGEDGAIVVGDTTLIPTYKKLTKQTYDKKNEEILKLGIDDPDLKGKPIRAIARGTGFNNGLSYNNEAIEYSVSNLIANQMGIEFNNPYFDAEDYNGAFTHVLTDFNPTGGPVPKLKTANNNLGIDHFDKDGNPVLKKVKLGRMDNYVTYPIYGVKTDENFQLNRFHTETDIYQTLLNEKFDFLINISSHDDYIREKGLEGYQPGKPQHISDYKYYNPTLDFFGQIIKRKNIKGVLINSTTTTSSRFTEIVSVDQVREELNKYQKGHLLDPSAKRIYINSKIDSLLGNRVNMNSKPYINNNQKISSFFTNSTEEKLWIYDKPIRSKLAEQMNWPEVDVNFILTQIYIGKYTTIDGINISSKDVYGTDMLFRNHLVSIIIANEALMAINKFYGTSFPYLNTKEYLK